MPFRPALGNMNPVIWVQHLNASTTGFLFFVQIVREYLMTLFSHALLRIRGRHSSQTYNDPHNLPVGTVTHFTDEETELREGQ